MTILMVRRRVSAVSNHEAPLVAFILRDAATPLLRMRSDTHASLRGGSAPLVKASMHSTIWL
jgi:hypothetical protein